MKRRGRGNRAPKLGVLPKKVCFRSPENAFSENFHRFEKHYLADGRGIPFILYGVLYLIYIFNLRT
jgi:hypothetical protein